MLAEPALKTLIEMIELLSIYVAVTWPNLLSS